MNTIRIYDRKTARHNWNIYCQTGNVEHAALLASAHIAKLRDWGKWPAAQIGIDVGPQESDVAKIDNLRSNTTLRFVFDLASESDVASLILALV